MTVVTIYISNSQVVELHEWLDDHHPTWLFYRHKEMTFTSRLKHHKQWRFFAEIQDGFGYARWPNMFVIENLTELDLVAMKLRWGNVELFSASRVV